MKTMQQLLSDVSAGEVVITDIDVVETDQGGILRVHMQSMKHPDVLAMTVDLPDEVSDQYDFQNAGEKWKRGWNNLTNELKKKGGTG